MAPELIDGRVSESRLQSATWGTFFLWIGIALLARFDWGTSLLGIGIILLGAQVVRRAIGLPTEWFAIVLGSVFLVGAVAELLRFSLGIHVGLLPILCIIAGAALLAKALARRHPHADDGRA